uniref:NADH-ubiquinone oxidoreductase chain 4 n=1 Tax=Thulinius sp. DVL-2010 TaxID=867920 RepID=F8RJB8_9BILA|nr:NADH dehydrogenase subunit 4 [Thulinius sp. DVL-2010]ADK97600.1 NADH dehydrogenase subunit 4 [Thulinius sp. DVL-2010]
MLIFPLMIFFVFHSSGIYLVIMIFFFFFFIYPNFSFFWSANLFFISDKFTFLLVLISSWLALLIKILLFSYKKKMKLALLLLMSGLLFFFLNFSFLSLNFMSFYIFFEISLIPLIFMILGWGYQVERIGAMFYLVIYTLVGSLPLLMVLLSIFSFDKNLSWVFFSSNFNFSFVWVVFFVIVMFSFFIKLPMYLVHLWLPKAHVEAPGFGSMVLAAVLLKLSGYGVYRILTLFFLKTNVLLNCFFLMTLIGSVLAAWICVTQTDTKSLIAYSSVSHMGVLMAGLMTQIWDSITGVFLISLAHGFCSSALFFLSGQSYDQIFSRQLLISRGRFKMFLCSSIFWILFLLINFSVPPFLSIFGELFVMGGLFWVNFLFWIVSGLNMMIVSFFCIYFFMVSIHGRLNFFKSLMPEIDLLFMLSILHFVPLVGLVLKLILFL